MTTQSVVRLNLGWWRPDRTAPVCDAIAIRGLIGSVKAPLAVVNTATGIGVAVGGETRLGVPNPGPDFLPLLATLPPITPDMLGDPAFQSAHGLRYSYMTGAMANGIGSADIVEEMGRAGMLGSFGAAGLCTVWMIADSPPPTKKGCSCQAPHQPLDAPAPTGV